jgi:L-fuculose-phosphate aldolase
VPYGDMAPEDLAAMPVEGEYGSWDGPLAPSSEWRFHLDITRARPEVGAIVHAHSTFATALAIARKDIPACHYMIAAAGGPTIRCGTYATYGTKELSAAALKALEGRSACLLANHGMIATGPDLDKAMWLAVELETIARQYVVSLSIGGPVLLSDAEIAKVKESFKSYGPRGRELAVKAKGKKAH